MKAWSIVAVAAGMAFIPVLSISLTDHVLVVLSSPVVAFVLLLGLSIVVALKSASTRTTLAVLLGSVPVSIGGIATAGWINRGWSPENTSAFVQIWIWALAVGLLIHVVASVSVALMAEMVPSRASQVD